MNSVLSRFLCELLTLVTTSSFPEEKLRTWCCSIPQLVDDRISKRRNNTRLPSYPSMDGDRRVSRENKGEPGQPQPTKCFMFDSPYAVLLQTSSRNAASLFNMFAIRVSTPNLLAKQQARAAWKYGK